MPVGCRGVASQNLRVSLETTVHATNFKVSESGRCKFNCCAPPRLEYSVIFSHSLLMSARRLFSAFVTFHFTLAVSLGQDLPTTVQVNTRLVTVNVVVRDSMGNPVLDLTKADFSILDDGKPQDLAFFSTATSRPSLASSPSPPNVYTNMFSRGSVGAPDSATVILFDTLNAKWSSQGLALSQVRKFLEQINPEERVGIYVLGRELKLIHDFDQDSSELVSEIRRHDLATSPDDASRDSAATTGLPELDNFLSGKDNTFIYARDRHGNPAAAAEFQQFRSQMTISSLQAIARHLEPLRGRKSIVWICDSNPYSESLLAQTLIFGPLPAKRAAPARGSDHPGGRAGTRPPENIYFGFILSGDYHPADLDVELMVRLLNREGIAFYPVDAQGLQGYDLGFGSPGSTGLPRPSRLGSSASASHSGFEELAARTGGRASYNRNDIATGIRRALDDSSFSYSLGYYPSHDRWNGEFRKLTIKVSKPGAQALARQGYFAMPAAREVSSENQIAVIRRVAATLIDAAQLPIEVQVQRYPDRNHPELPISIRFPLSEFLNQVGDSHWSAHVEVFLLQMDSAHTLLDATHKSMGAQLNSEEREGALHRLTEIPMTVPLKSTVADLCVVVTDATSTVLGSVHIPVAKYFPTTH
jgi:VWFA-related protein